MVVVSGADHGWNTAPRLPVTGASSVMSCSAADGTAVCATLSADEAAAGEPVMNCLSALLPADATVSTPATRRRPPRPTGRHRTAGHTSEPSDMLMMSTWSRMSPSPFGSSANSIACSSAMPLHDVAGAEHALSA